MNKDRRMASSINTRPHYRKTAEADHALAFAATMGLTFVVGAMVGAYVCLGYMSL